MIRLRELNALPADQAAERLRACCASTRWVAAMVAARPFADRDALLAAADRAWAATGPADWDEAFAAHPRIGTRANIARAGRVSSAWSRDEQARAGEAEPETRAEVARLNVEYERRFGRIYIVCASGRTGDSILHDLRTRLGNPPDQEARIAAGEQHRITRLRLDKLISAEET